MTEPIRRNRLMPWYAGIAIIAVLEGYLIWRNWQCVCEIPALELVIVMVVLPVLYLFLMWLTLRSQD